MDMVEDIRTLTNISNDAQKWKADNGRTSSNTPSSNAPPPPLGQKAGEVNISVDDEAFL